MEYTRGDAKEIGLIDNNIEQQVSIDDFVSKWSFNMVLIDSNQTSRKIYAITSSHICVYMPVRCMR